MDRMFAFYGIGDLSKPENLPFIRAGDACLAMVVAMVIAESSHAHNK